MSERAVTSHRASDVKPGEMVAVGVDGLQIAIANVDGRYYAFDDTCTHELCSLAEGFLEGETVTCPCHSGQFDVTTGDAVAPPVFEPVKTYPVRVQDDRFVIEV